MDLKELSLTTRQRLAEAACVAAWSDTRVVPEERAIIDTLCNKLALSDDFVRKVNLWLKHGPPDFDPFQIEAAHRDLFLNVVQDVFKSDGYIDPLESETYQLLVELLG